MVTRKLLDPLDEAEDALHEMKKLGGDEEEQTGKVQVPSIHVHAHHPSQPDIEREPGKIDVAVTVAKRLPPWGLTAAVLVLGLAAIAAWVAVKLAGR